MRFRLGGHRSIRATTGLNTRLAPDSPAIDAGVDTGLAFDFAGLFRPLGEGFDLGAYEFDAVR